MTNREQYDTLVAASNEEHRRAGIAVRERDYERYKAHVLRSWDYMREAQPIWERLSETEQKEITASAYESMSTAFLTLGRMSGRIK